MSPMYFVKQMKREDVPGIFCDEDFLQLNAWSVDIFKKQLTNVNR